LSARRSEILNLSPSSRQETSSLEYQEHARTVRRINRKLRDLPWYKAARGGGKGNPVLLCRAWVRCAVGVRGGLGSYASLLMHGANRGVLEGNFARWSVWRADGEKDQALKNAVFIMKRMGEAHVVEMGKGEGEVREMVNPPSQWWPMPFGCYKKRQRFDEEFNPRKNGGKEEERGEAGIEGRVKEVGSMIKEEIKNTNTIEEGMDKFA
ncbi:hypothetical protein TrRE_jg1335, partial [Triparma retinervis]